MRKERQGTGKCLVGCWDPGHPSPGVEEPWIWPRLALGYSLPCGREVWGGFCASKERKKQWPLCPLTLVTESWVGVLLGDKLGHFSLKAFLEQNIKAGERPEDYLGHWFFIVFFFFFFLVADHFKQVLLMMQGKGMIILPSRTKFLLEKRLLEKSLERLLGWVWGSKGMR